MGVFDFLKSKKKDENVDLNAIMPQNIYEANVLELRDIIAPSALKVTPRELHLGDKVTRSFFVFHILDI